MGDVIVGFGPQSKITGLLAAVTRKVRIHWDSTRGPTYYTEWDGASQEQMAAVFNDAIALGMTAEITYENDVARLTIQDPTQEWTLDSWEIVGNEETRDGLSHPSITAILGTPPNDYYYALRQALEQNNPSQSVYNQFLNQFSFSSQNATTVTIFYELQQAGSPEYRHGQYVIRHKTNVSNRWQTNIADFGVDQIYTPAQVISEVSNGSLWNNVMPPRLQYKILQIPDPNPVANYLWGWLKAASTETSAASNRVDITTEYTLEQWSTEYYSPYAG